ncbi:hypothetical protein LZ31DRAFT_629274, partial [Colletotrichum somersetense]
ESLARVRTGALGREGGSNQQKGQPFTGRRGGGANYTPPPPSTYGGVRPRLCHVLDHRRYQHHHHHHHEQDHSRIHLSPPLLHPRILPLPTTAASRGCTFPAPRPFCLRPSPSNPVATIFKNDRRTLDHKGG